MSVPQPTGVLVGEKGRAVEQCRLAHNDGAACAGPGTRCTHHQNRSRNHARSASHKRARTRHVDRSHADAGVTQTPESLSMCGRSSLVLKPHEGAAVALGIRASGLRLTARVENVCAVRIHPRSRADERAMREQQWREHYRDAEHEMIGVLIMIARRGRGVVVHPSALVPLSRRTS